MKSQYLLFAFAFFAINGANAQVKISKENLEVTAGIGQNSVALLQSCSDAFGTPYTDIAGLRDTQLLRLVAAAGYDLDAFTPLHYKKVAVMKSLYPKNEMVVSNCDSSIRGAKRDMASIDKLLSTDKRMLKKSANATGTTGNACDQAAEFYQSRFQVTGKLSDLTCFQMAGRRESDAAAR